MGEVQSWVFTICSGTLMCGVFSILVPGKAFEKVTRLILALFLLICFLTPVEIDLSDLSPDMDAAEEIRNRVAENADSYFFRAAAEKSEEAIIEIVLKQMAQYDIKEEDIQIYIETEEGSPEGEEKRIVVSVTLPAQMRQNHTVIHKALEYELGTDVQLEYREEEKW